MKLEEVPPDVYAVRCTYCGDHLGVPFGVTPGSAGYVEIIRDHHVLCPRIPNPCDCRRCAL